ncbi:uncharacterized protein si:dkey-191g9.7 [Esox lucius]|nr:uncharacterized protein si:dkey-191g9.7 [Esox lucius]XP_019902578.2 uncharacterized protein si:dkey-191g9.7 [Esox lucius]XP_019902579.2 uncharacterized protein si:dkey-191g9.7 [Esox lucius]
MAEAGRPVSELDNGNSVSPDSALCTDPLLPHSMSSTDGVTHPLRLEELRRSSSELSSPCCRRDPKKDHPGPTQAAQKSDRPHIPDHVDQRTAVRPRSMAESPYTAHQREEAINNHGPFGESEVPQPSSSERDQIGLDLPRLPVHRSHSDTLHMSRKAPALPPHSETTWPSHPGRDYLLQNALPTLACGQPMQLQDSSPVNTMCTQPSQAGRVWVRAPGPINAASAVGREAQNPRSRQDANKCYCSFAQPHGILEDTFAAYCHPQPIPAPAQLVPRLLGAEAEFGEQRALPLHPEHALLSLPRLMSSVSETGLDAKRLLQCCNLNCNINCSWASGLPPSVALQKYMQENSCIGSNNRITRDMGTMTTSMELRDVGVQTGRVDEARPAHVFPQVCLVEENGNDDRNESDNRNECAKETDTSQKPPVKEVKWDAEGMTWEVYGASVDPEELGLAIQKHLELQIRETSSRAAKLSHDNTATSRKSSGGAEGKRKRGKVIGSFRTPSCCALSSTAVD